MFIAIELIRFIGPLTGSFVDKFVLLVPAGIMVVLTILLFVIGMTGLCGAFQESKCLHGMVGCFSEVTTTSALHTVLGK